MMRSLYLTILTLSTFVFSYGCETSNEEITNAGNASAGEVSAGSASAGDTPAGETSGGDPLDEPEEHRAQAMQCDMEREEWEFMPREGEMCQSHDDCVEDINGNGVLDEGEDINGNGLLDVNGRCSSGRISVCTFDTCFEDDTCGDYVCLCRVNPREVNHCLRQGNCKIDADCGEGGYCGPSLGDCGNYSGAVGFFCHTANDLCRNDADCPGQTSGSCRYSESDGYWACSDTECVGK